MRGRSPRRLGGGSCGCRARARHARAFVRSFLRGKRPGGHAGTFRFARAGDEGRLEGRLRLGGVDGRDARRALPAPERERRRSPRGSPGPPVGLRERPARRERVVREPRCARHAGAAARMGRDPRGRGDAGRSLPRRAVRPFEGRESPRRSRCRLGARRPFPRIRRKTSVSPRRRRRPAPRNRLPAAWTPRAISGGSSRRSRAGAAGFRSGRDRGESSGRFGSRRARSPWTSRSRPTGASLSSSTTGQRTAPCAPFGPSSASGRPSAPPSWRREG